MRITFLGTAAALADPDRCQTSIVISLDNGRHYMFDCGEGATRQMVKANINPVDVQHLFLTHLHMDHIIGIPFFVLSSWILNRRDKVRIFGPKGTSAFIKHCFEGGAFDVDIRARGAFLLRQNNIEAIRPEVVEFSEGAIFDDGLMKVEAHWVEHIPRNICECFGFRIAAEGKVVAISSDTRHCPNVTKLARNADLLIHECTFPEAFIEHRRKSGVGTFNHTSPAQVGAVAVEANAKALVATHIGHFDSTSPVLKRAAGDHMPVELMGPHLLDDVASDIRKAFKGPLYIAHDLMRIDL
jgi:ribonuclease Z